MGTHECQVFCGEDDLGSRAYAECTKNPGHHRFISVKEFNEQHLAEENRTPEIMEAIRKFSARTVKITVKYTSHLRPDTYPNSDNPYPYADIKGDKRVRRCGTGYVFDMERVNKPCLCPECTMSDNPKRKYFLFKVWSAATVVFDEHEALSTKIELFYDDEEKTGVKIAYGVSLTTDLFYDLDQNKTDSIELVCVSHDDLSFQEIASLEYGYLCENVTSITQYVIISHPHGQSKKITVGDGLYYELPNCSDPKDKKENNLKRSFNYLSWYSVNAPVPFPECGEKFGHPLEPGRRYELLDGSSYEIPFNAPYAYRVDKDFKYVTFPPGTKFWSHDHKNLPLMPETTKFHFDGTEGTVVFFYEGYDLFCVYDTPTCPGSSGAFIHTSKEYDIKDFFHLHSGNIGNGINRSNVVISDFGGSCII